MRREAPHTFASARDLAVAGCLATSWNETGRFEPKRRRTRLRVRALAAASSNAGVRRDSQGRFNPPDHSGGFSFGRRPGGG